MQSASERNLPRIGPRDAGRQVPVSVAGPTSWYLVNGGARAMAAESAVVADSRYDVLASMFWGERKIVEETYSHLKLLSPNRGRARAHYIGFKVLETITEHY